MAKENLYTWTDNPTLSGVALCNTDVLNDCLMHLKYDKKDGGTGLQMFDTILKDHILTYEESQGLALQGTYVYKEALAGSRYGYPDFYNKVIEEFNQATTTETVNGVIVKVHSNGHKFYNIADKTGIDEFFNTIGSAWFYGIDTANERIFLPRDNFFAIKGVAAVVGNGMTLGLTDGTKNYGLVWMNGISAVVGNYGVNVGSSYSGNGVPNGSLGITTDPTKSGIEAHLTANEDKYLYICVGNTTNYKGVSDVVNQGMDILEQVNQGIESRVAKDSMREVPCIVDTYVNGTSGYRIWSDNFCEQWGRAVGSATVSLLKPYIDTNYNISLGGEIPNGGNNSQTGNVQWKATDSFKLYTPHGGNPIDWHSCGYIA